MPTISLNRFPRGNGAATLSPAAPPRRLLSNHFPKRPTTTDLEDARRLLCDCVLFRKLARHERNVLAARAHMRRFEPGDTIFLTGALNDSMIAVLDGEVRISMSSADGKEVVFAIVRAGEVFGEIAMLDGKPRSADARALTASKVAVLKRFDVMTVLARNPTAWLGLVEVLCSRLRHTDQHLVEVALWGLPQRLAKSLLRLVDAARIQAPDRTGLRLSQCELANLVGASRESVNKCLQEWRRAGIIRMNKRVIRIADRTALETMLDPQ
jgi:CRP-like cAMP-binding protein